MRVRVSAKNNSGRDAQCWVEPWGFPLPFASAQTLELILNGPAPGQPEIEADGGDLIVWAWGGAHVENEQLGARASPMAPPGMTLSSTLGAMGLTRPGLQSLAGFEVTVAELGD